MDYCVRYDELDGCTWNDVCKYVEEQVRLNGDLGGTDHVTLVLPDIQEGRKEAEKLLRDTDALREEKYGGYATKYYEYLGFTTKKIKDFQIMLSSLEKEEKKYIEEHMPNRARTDFVRCRNCGSKIAKVKLFGTKCPVCLAEMRTKAVLKRIASYEKKKKLLLDKIEAEIRSQKGSKKEKWLVKYEYIAS